MKQLLGLVKEWRAHAVRLRSGKTSVMRLQGIAWDQAANQLEEKLKELQRHPLPRLTLGKNCSVEDLTAPSLQRGS